MFYGLNPDMVRYLMRKVRKDKGWTQNDVSDDDMCYGTISNIERGVENVDEKKVFRYLEKLDLADERKLTDLVKQVELDIDDINFQLQQIESMIDNNRLSNALLHIKKISIESFHPLAPFFNYLRGRYYYAQKEWKNAEISYKLAIRLCSRYKLNPTDNIVSACYNELSICSYAQNNPTQANIDAENGLSAYDESKERKDIKHSLMSNKIVYLLRSSKYFEASKTLDDIWHLISQIDSIYVVLTLYKSKAIILRKMRNYPEAIKVCTEGMDIARRNKTENRQLDLINILGSIFLLRKEFKKSKQRFQSVIDYDHNGRYPRMQIEALTYLAILHLNEKNWTEAEKQIQKAIDIGRNKGTMYQLTKALIVCGNIYFDQKQYKEAAPYYKEAEQIAEKNNFKYRQHTALLKYAYCSGNMNKENEPNVLINKVLMLQHNINIESEDEIYGPE